MVYYINSYAVCGWRGGVKNNFSQYEGCIAEQYESIEDAKSGIFEYIEVFYNRIRRHSANGYVSPAEFERMTAIAA
ncbi:hypothetical protein DKT75_12725 [Leucothrix arctica]|uniref:Integrase catalytic domain-containing protein n=1 Tax=Leucothrix arctica TaxID=1481894 RepID=A0A317CAG5_9GAMM|nr:hypothetical protein DKT75_12725 [Leucothrix arctica]